MAKPKRSPQRAAAVIDRAARMGKSKVPLMERRLGDPQMRTVGYDPNALRPDRVNGGDIKRLGLVQVPIENLRTSQPTVSAAHVKAKIASPSSRPPQAVKGPGKLWDVIDGNHSIMAARARGDKMVTLHGGELPPGMTRAATVASKATSAYSTATPYLQAAGIIAAASTAYNASREANGTRSEALTSAAKAAAPGAIAAAAVPALAYLAPRAAAVVSKFNPLVLGGTLAYSTIKGAYDGYNEPARDRTWGEWAKGEQAPKAGWAGAAKGAAFGAADALTFGVASALAGRQTKVTAPSNPLGFDPMKPRFTEPTKQKRSDAPVRLDDSQQRKFAQANASFGSGQKQESEGPTRPGYKDQWSDSRGRQYTRKNMAVRKRQDMKEAA